MIFRGVLLICTNGIKGDINMTSAIDTLIEKEEFTHWSQNIYQTNDLEKIGEEYLFRGSIGNPEVIFNKARERNRLFELDMKSIYRAVSTFFQKIKSTILDRDRKSTRLNSSHVA